MANVVPSKTDTDAAKEAPAKKPASSTEDRLKKVESAITHLERIYGFDLGVDDSGDTDDDE